MEAKVIHIPYELCSAKPAGETIIEDANLTKDPDE